jgi:hypothetical protein
VRVPIPIALSGVGAGGIIGTSKVLSQGHIPLPTSYYSIKQEACHFSNAISHAHIKYLAPLIDLGQSQNEPMVTG